MRIANKDIGNFISRDFKKYAAILLYGPDTGLVDERTKILVDNHIKDKNSSLNNVHLKYKDISNDPSILTDEITSHSLFSDKKAIIIDNIMSTFPKPLQEIIELNKDHVIIFKAEDLSTTSTIRKHFETKKYLAALPCYSEDITAIKQRFLKLLAQNNLALENQNEIDNLAELMHGNYKFVESEIKKLVLFYNNKKHHVIPNDELYSIISKDNLLFEYDALFRAIINNDNTQYTKSVTTILEAGENIITILRQVSSLFTKLLKAKTISIKNKTISQDTVLKMLKPPIFFKQLPMFKKALNQYSLDNILSTLEQITNFEIASKNYSLPNEAIIQKLHYCLIQSN